MESQVTIIDMIMQGWYATYPLLIISIVCVTIIIERIWALWGLSARASRLADALVDPMRRGKFDEALAHLPVKRSPDERVFRELINEAHAADRTRLEGIVEERRFPELMQLRGPLWRPATSCPPPPFTALS